ncbi:MAG: hypothetical protein AAF296_12435 [Pseudomonadota bacterium]
MRLLSSIFLGLLMTSAAVADDPKPASTEALYACASIDDGDERLACYDSAVGRLKAAEEAGEVTTISRAEVETVQREAFGFSLPSLPRIAMPRLGGNDDDSGKITQIQTAVTSIKESRVNGLRITLENGQVWQQTDGRQVTYSKRKGVKEATVKEAAFGSFMMKLDGGVAFRVKRVR